MSDSIASFGAKIALVATSTFPAGILITQFADDADSLDSASIQLGDAAMGPNGDMVTWHKPAIIPITLNIIPDSVDDINLSILAENNRVGAGKLSVQDDITLVIAYPSGRTISYSGGMISDAVLGLPSTSAGRMKSKPYSFKFDNIVQVFA